MDWTSPFEIPNFAPNVYKYYYKWKIMNSIQSQCTELKQKYDACYSVWFTDHFLKGNADESMCAPLYNMYQQCLKNSMKENHVNLKEIENYEFELEQNQRKSTTKEL